jgi:hypothetical protein
MREAGMITLNAAHGKRADATSIVPPSLDLFDGYPACTPALNATDVMRFVFAWIRSQAVLSILSISAVARIRANRLNSRPILPNFTGESLDYAREAALKFSRIRVWFFGRTDKCLLNSFALSEFLALYGLHTQWIFGVSVSPTFSAHCWLQLGHTVVNDSCYHVLKFTPIMTL